MNAPGLQTLLARVLADPRSARELHEAPEVFAARHGATQEQVSELAALGGEGLDTAVMITAAKRRRRVHNAFPATFALAEQLPAAQPLLHFTDFGEQPTSPEGSREVGRRLQLAVRELDDHDDPDGLAVLGELVAFETLWYEVRAAAQTTWGSTPGCPTLAPGARLAAFSRPIAEVHRRVLAGSPWRDVGRAGTHYTVQAGEGTRIRVRRVPTALWTLLTSCDGHTSAARLAALLELPPQRVERVLTDLVEQGVLIGN
ncbi:hypothetical protein [Saccharomonospora piscinae]|uniref:hypothetical protein n=1 Tax=Saccharomonospora piscinae TaxID=687388 RepID=UPI0004635B21|nr:hypothetical protein [Saccharomonospora piscinae]